MSDLLSRLSAFRRDGLANVVIDTPSGSSAKFTYDAKCRCYRLGRLLPAGMSFPYNFGSIPRTLAEDGDPLDLLVLETAPLFVGCLVHVRPIGVMKAEQTEAGKTIRNDRLLGEAVTETSPARYDSLDDIGQTRVAEIEHFFIAYNRAQGREFRPTGLGDRPEAERSIRSAQARYQRTKR